VYGSDVVVAVLNGRRIGAAEPGAVPTFSLASTLDRDLGAVRIAAMVDVALFALTRGAGGTRMWLAIGAIVCLGLRWGFTTRDRELFERRGVPVLRARAVVSAIGFFYLVTAGIAH
jgi:hypothetical protein